MRALRHLSRGTRTALGGGCLLACAAVAVPLVWLSGGSSADALNNGGGLTYGGIVSPPGLVADFPLQIENASSAPVTLESARLVAVPGYPLPKLVHLGVMTEHDGLITSAVGWPVWRANSPASTYRLVPFRGYVVLPWKVREHRHLGPFPDMIEYGVLGTDTDTDYWAAGLSVTYRLQGQIHTQTLYEGAADCMGKVELGKPATLDAVYNKYCRTVDPRANRELEKIAA